MEQCKQLVRESMLVHPDVLRLADAVARSTTEVGLFFIFFCPNVCIVRRDRLLDLPALPTTNRILTNAVMFYCNSTSKQVSVASSSVIIYYYIALLYYYYCQHYFTTIYTM